jgi:hypothetical protein
MPFVSSTTFVSNVVRMGAVYRVIYYFPVSFIVDIKIGTPTIAVYFPVYYGIICFPTNAA